MKLGLGLGLNRNVVASAAGPAPLDQVEASALWDIDVTQEDSYGGSGETITNLTAQGTTYDWWMGDDGDASDNPVFTGSAGDPAAYMAFTGNNSMVVKTQPAFIRDMHKTTGGSDFWVACALQIPASTGTIGLFATQSGNTTEGTRFNIISNDTVSFIQRGSSAVAAPSTQTITEATPSIIIVSHSHSTNVTRFWLNTATGEDVAHTFSTSTTDATADMVFGKSTTLEFANGGRIYAFSGGGTFLGDSGAAAIIAEYELRHERTYI